jgi:hypothetical protein
MRITFTVVLEYDGSPEQYRWAGPATSPSHAHERALAQAREDNEDSEMEFQLLMVCPGDISPYIYGPNNDLPAEISVVEKQFETAIDLFNKSFGKGL